MYLKLALRNAKRSLFDYLLYIAAVVVFVSIIYLANYTAAFGKIQAGFQTASLPLLIGLIMIVLVDYINTFIIRQRAKELATYLLLGMEKKQLSRMFLLELSIIGAVCFLLGVLLGSVFSFLCFYILENGAGSPFPYLLITKSIPQTLVYFGIVEILSIFRMRQKIYKLQIIGLMQEKRRNQPISGNKVIFWRRIFMLNLLWAWISLYGIVFLPDERIPIFLSTISLPVLGLIFAFYKLAYAFFSSKRLFQPDALYKGNRLYWLGEMTRGIRTSANINTVFCICLLLSSMSFQFGMLLLNKDFAVFPSGEQQWMGFLQISICIIFLSIYFSVLSLGQIIEWKQQIKHIVILHYLGKTQKELRALVRNQILIKLFMPAFLCFAILLTAAPWINYKVNTILPVSMHHSLLKAMAAFLFCFVALYLCYFCIIYLMSRRYIKRNLPLLSMPPNTWKPVSLMEEPEKIKRF